MEIYIVVTSLYETPHRGRAALFLDFDGTLIDIAPTPGTVEVPNGLGALLLKIKQALGGAVAIISGRPISEIDHLIGAIDVAIVGVHGAEVRIRVDDPIRSEVPPAPPQAITELRAAAAAFEGVWIEEKGSALAIHYRAAAPEIVGALERRLSGVLDPYSDHLIVSPGRKVFEVVPRTMSKGVALAAMMRRPAFAGRVPIMVGDDHSDESAMTSAERLGGYGLRVAGEHFPRDSATFRDPAAVRAWLNAFAEGTTP